MTSSYPLAIFTPTLGKRSETFIKRHANDLLPGMTVLICHSELTDTSSEWGFEGPLLNLSDAVPMPWNVKIISRLKRQLRIPQEDYEWTVIKNFLISNNVKAMLCEYLNYSIQWIRLAQETGIRMYAHAHGYDVSTELRNPRWIEAYKQLNLIDGVITMNSISKQRLIEIGVKESLISVFPYGIYLPSEMPEYSINKHVKCLAVGRMTGKKAPIYLLESFRLALESYPDMSLDFVGDGEFMLAVMQFIDVVGIAEKVKLHGSQPISFVHDLMQNADIFLQHSITNPLNGDEEGMPIAILEAMGHGLPVVSTLHAGIPESVEDGMNGYLVPEGDLIHMSKKIIALASDPLKRREFGERGREIVKKKFTWDTERQNLLEVMNLT